MSVPPLGKLPTEKVESPKPPEPGLLRRFCSGIAGIITFIPRRIAGFFESRAAKKTLILDILQTLQLTNNPVAKGRLESLSLSELQLVKKIAQGDQHTIKEALQTHDDKGWKTVKASLPKSQLPGKLEEQVPGFKKDSTQLSAKHDEPLPDAKNLREEIGEKLANKKPKGTDETTVLKRFSSSLSTLNQSQLLRLRDLLANAAYAQALTKAALTTSLDLKSLIGFLASPEGAKAFAGLPKLHPSQLVLLLKGLIPIVKSSPRKATNFLNALKPFLHSATNVTWHLENNMRALVNELSKLSENEKIPFEDMILQMAYYAENKQHPNDALHKQHEDFFKRAGSGLTKKLDQSPDFLNLCLEWDTDLRGTLTEDEINALLESYYALIQSHPREVPQCFHQLPNHLPELFIGTPFEGLVNRLRALEPTEQAPINQPPTPKVERQKTEKKEVRFPKTPEALVRRQEFAKGEEEEPAAVMPVKTGAFIERMKKEGVDTKILTRSVSGRPTFLKWIVQYEGRSNQTLSGEQVKELKESYNNLLKKTSKRQRPFFKNSLTPRISPI